MAGLQHILSHNYILLHGLGVPSFNEQEKLAPGLFAWNLNVKLLPIAIGVQIGQEIDKGQSVDKMSEEINDLIFTKLFTLSSQIYITGNYCSNFRKAYHSCHDFYRVPSCWQSTKHLTTNAYTTLMLTMYIHTQVTHMLPMVLH